MPTPSALTHTPLSELIKKFLKAGIDSYNSSDLSLSTPNADADSLGERARLCLNLALQQIYDLIKDSKYLEAYPTTNLSSVAGQDYIDLDPEAMLDDIQAVTERTNHIKLHKRNWAWYRRNFPDPSLTSGISYYYIRRGDRLYLAPRPSAAIPYVIDFIKFTGDLVLNGDLPLIPTRYDYWILSEAVVIWYTMEDPSSVPALVLAERESKRKSAMDSIFTGFDQVLQAESNTERIGLRAYPYERPVGGTS